MDGNGVLPRGGRPFCLVVWRDKFSPPDRIYFDLQYNEREYF